MTQQTQFKAQFMQRQHEAAMLEQRKFSKADRAAAMQRIAAKSTGSQDGKRRALGSFDLGEEGGDTDQKLEDRLAAMERMRQGSFDLGEEGGDTDQKLEDRLAAMERMRRSFDLGEEGGDYDQKLEDRLAAMERMRQGSFDLGEEGGDTDQKLEDRLAAMERMRRSFDLGEEGGDYDQKLEDRLAAMERMRQRSMGGLAHGSALAGWGNDEAIDRVIDRSRVRPRNVGAFALLPGFDGGVRLVALVY